MVEIIPAILTDSVTEFEEKIGRVNEAVDANGANIKRVQVDIIDGIFANNKTVDPANLVGIDTNLSLDFHLMVKEPVNWVEKCARAGADRIIGQIEMMKSQVEFVEKVAQAGLYVGLAIDIATPVSMLDPVVLSNLDVVLVMSVPAGFGGQKFDPRALAKIDELSEIRARDSTPFKICVDGGETQSNIDETHFAGADEVVIGGRLFKGDIAENIKRFELAAHGINK